MPKLQSNLLELLDSESDDGLGLEINKSTSRTTKPSMAAAKKSRSNPATSNRVTKTASTSRRHSGRIAAAIEKAEERAALTEKSGNQQSAKTAAAKGGKRGIKAKDESNTESTSPVKTKPGRGRPKKASNTDKIQDAPEVRRGTAAPSWEEEETEIPETQSQDLVPEPDSMDLDDDDSEENLASLDMEDSPDVVPPSASRHVPFGATPRKGGEFGSAVPSGEPALRRRLGELTKKHEALEVRYRDLREVAVREAERNFDRLRKQSDQRDTASRELVAQLRSELDRHRSVQRNLTKDCEELRRQLDDKTRKIDTLMAQNKEADNDLRLCKEQNKVLAAKLAAAEAKAPVGAASSAQMQMKEDLYGDLTGLIVRAVKKDGGEDVFDCIQTGRNGSEY
jgi:hypothetical protein